MKSVPTGTKNKHTKNTYHKHTHTHKIFGKFPAHTAVKCLRNQAGKKWIPQTDSAMGPFS